MLNHKHCFYLETIAGNILSKKKNFYFAFVDLEKAFDGVPRDVVWWAWRMQGVEEWLVKIIQCIYRNSRSCVRVNKTVSDDFLVHIGLLQSLVLSSSLFMVMLEIFYMENWPGSSEEMLYANDLVLVKHLRA